MRFPTRLERASRLLSVATALYVRWAFARWSACPCPCGRSYLSIYLSYGLEWVLLLHRSPSGYESRALERANCALVCKASGLYYNIMRSPVAAEDVPPFDPTKCRYDQSSYAGRLRHFLNHDLSVGRCEAENHEIANRGVSAAHGALRFNPRV